MLKQRYAHSKEGCPLNEWQTLEDHSENVSLLAGKFADCFGSKEWARFLGELHDIGKARQSFQDYIAVANNIEGAHYDGSDKRHAGIGAAWAVSKFGKLGRILAYIIAGHHGGLADWQNGSSPTSALSQTLIGNMPTLNEAEVAKWISAHESKWLKHKLVVPWKFKKGELALWIRMLYSCIVDADFLDTESFMARARNSARSKYPPLSDLYSRFFRALNEKQKAADNTPVNAIRAEIREACEKAADLPPGIFTQEVPTGGGKTLSSMAFAFKHAMRYGKKRIIYAIPYTSIIEQTANVLRIMLGDASIVEHHSNILPEKETRATRLASENWDAPIIITTDVQFFESLYSNMPSKCRRLHNIANSVVILDEVQLLPMHLLEPCMDVIGKLAERYGTTFVLSSATMPHLDKLAPCARAMIPAEMRLHERLKRININFPKTIKERKSWDEVAAELMTYKQVLCVVNTRRDCRDLTEKMPAGTIHLSATMCGAHRSKVIEKIKQLLKARKPVRVVSTQLVECGVDIDFPVVYRAFTGLGSIIQSGGRCNREGRDSAHGKVVVFMPPTQSPRGTLLKSENAMKKTLANPCHSDLDSPQGFKEFFETFKNDLVDLGGSVLEDLQGEEKDAKIMFLSASEKFQMIDDSSVSVIVRYDGSDELIDRVIEEGPTRETMRSLQRYSVNVPRSRIASLKECGFIEEIKKGDEEYGIYIQTIPQAYNDRFGLDMFCREEKKLNFLV